MAILVLLPLLTGCGSGSGGTETDVAGDETTAANGGTLQVRHVEAAEAVQLLSGQRIVVVDVRTAKEYDAGHIAGATNIDFYGSDFERRIQGLDRERTYLVHCAVGGRSRQALDAFRKSGFKSVIHLDGGFKGWQRAGAPVEKR